MQKFDVLIVGAGMVGLTLALAIRKQSKLTVALIDNSPIKPISDEPEVRVSAINAVSQQLFSNLDVWSAIESSRVQAYQQMHVWDKAGAEVLNFTVADITSNQQSISNRTDELGYIIENNVIRNALWEKCQQDSAIHFINDANIADISFGDSETFISFDSQAGSFTKPVIASLVVGADGANSWVRQKMNFTMSFRDYDHHAIVATVQCSQGHQNTAWQVFLNEGPLALLPLKSASSLDNDGELCSIVWSTTPEEAKRLVSLTPEQFSKEITAAVDGKLGVVNLVSERFTYPLSMRLCQRFTEQRVVLVGDAAHTIHPLAGQGVNLGLLDAGSLAQVITQDDTLTKSQYLDTQLQHYSRWRISEATEMVAAMEAIKQLFTPQNKVVQTIRAIGLAVINSVVPAKKVLIKQALGYKGEMPELSKSLPPSAN